MASNTSSQNQNRGLINKLLLLLVFLFVCLLGSILVEWVVMTKWYPHQGAMHSVSLLNSELSYLGRPDVLNNTGGKVVIGTLLKGQQATFSLLTESTRLAPSLNWLASLEFLTASFEAMGWLNPQTYVVSTINMIQVFTLRVVVVILSAPIYLLVAAWGISMGLTRRSIRRYQVVNESSYLFHHARRIKIFSVIAPISIYLAWPTELSPLLVFGPAAVLYSMSWFVMAAKFKKAL